MSIFDECAAIVQSMKHLLSEATLFLPLYEVRSAQQVSYF